MLTEFEFKAIPDKNNLLNKSFLHKSSVHIYNHRIT